MSDILESYPIAVRNRIEEALEVLRVLGLPQAQLNERSALTLLALLELEPASSWSKAKQPMLGITPIMDYVNRVYGKEYKPNTRESVRKGTVHQFLDAGIIVINPDDPERRTNSPNTVYQIEPDCLGLLKKFGTKNWDKELRTFLSSIKTLKEKYANERLMKRIPLIVNSDQTINLSPGSHNELIKCIIEEFAQRFAHNAILLYVGDTEKKFAYFDEAKLKELGIEIEPHSKMPDVIIYRPDKNWLILVEAVTSHGPVNPKRHEELRRLFASSKTGLVYLTAFLTRRAMTEYLSDISWETEVWVAEDPTHLIHFDGERFLGPYD